MKALEHFQQVVALPSDFGVSRPYARLYYVDPGRAAGADADVEYREMEAGRDQVVVTVSEWRLEEGQTQRSLSRVVTFSVKSGEILRPVNGPDEDLAELLAALSGMQLADGDAQA